MSKPEIVRAVVTQVSPLRVRLEGPDPSALGVTPDNFAGALAVNDTVLVARYPRGQIEVLARLGGPVDADTGWIDLAFETGFESYTASFPCRYRRIGNRVFLEGLVKRTAGDFAAATSSTVATIPSGYLPVHGSYFSSGTQTGKATPTIALTGGWLYVRPATDALAYASLAGISWLID